MITLFGKIEAQLDGLGIKYYLILRKLKEILISMAHFMVIPVIYLLVEYFPIYGNGHAKASAEAFKDAGYKYIEDQNGKFEDGYFPVTGSFIYETRVSAAMGYLTSSNKK